MDHTVTYRYGAILGALLQPLPLCCLHPHLSSDPTIYPTSRSHQEVSKDIRDLKWRPLSPVQWSGIARLRRRLAITDFRSFLTSSYEVESLAKCLIDLLGWGQLFERCEFVLAGPGTMRERGLTALTCRCDIHQQVHAVKIVINQDDDPGASKQADLRYLDRLEIALHEVCHAILDMSVDRRSLMPTESIVCMGIQGHGTLFTELFKAAAQFLRKHTGWVVDVNAACCRSVRRDRETGATALKVWRQICGNPLESARTYPGLSQFLTREPGDDMRLLYLMREGRDVLELVLMMLYSRRMGFDWRRPSQTLSRSDRAQRNPYSFIVEALTKNSVTLYVRENESWFDMRT